MNEYLNKRYKYAGDIFDKLISLDWETDTAESFLNSIPDADVAEETHCSKCIYKQRPVTEYPCSHCTNCYVDQFKPKDKEETV